MLEQKITIVLALVLLLMPALASAQSASESANQHKVMLDIHVERIDTVDYAGTTYQVIRYNNVFPHANHDVLPISARDMDNKERRKYGHA